MRKIIAIFIALLLTGCSGFRGHTQTLNVQCPDAVIKVNGQIYDSPALVDVKRNRKVSLQCYRADYYVHQETIGYHLNTTGALDVVGTILFLVPCVGLFSPGAYSLDTTDVYVELVKK